MFTNDEQNQLLNAALSAAAESISESLGRSVDFHLDLQMRPDQDAEVTLVVGALSLPFSVEVKTTLSSGYLLSRVARPREKPPLLATRRLSRNVMAFCRRFGIGCIDVDGNVFLRWPDGVVDIEGRPAARSKEVATEGSGTVMVSRAGLQLLFVLLAYPNQLDANVRTLAKAAGVSVGSVSGALKGLVETGLIRTVGTSRRLVETTALVDLWVDGYRRRLHRRLSLGAFTATEPTWWLGAAQVVREQGGQWGGESALWVAGQLRPERGVIYIDATAAKLVRALRLRRAEPADATAELRQRFWRVADSAPTVPALLVYADLLADGDPRLLEAAASLRQDAAELRRVDGA